MPTPAAYKNIIFEAKNIYTDNSAGPGGNITITAKNINAISLNTYELSVQAIALLVVVMAVQLL